jgi:hypothetical protein
MYNEQVIGERLWADRDFVQKLPADEATLEQVRPVVDDHLSVPFGEVIDRVTEEVISTVDRAHQFAEDEDIGRRDAYELKHIVANAQVRGEDEFPTSAVRAHKCGIDDTDRVKTAFYSPDIDGCVENLHITECIAAEEQSDTLSYVVLEALRDHLIETVPTTEAAKTMFDRELPPGGETNGSSVFLDF